MNLPPPLCPSLPLSLPPSRLPGKLFRGGPLKLLFVFLMPAFYSLRPLFVRPKKPSNWELVNVLAQLTFDALIFYILGWKSLFYLVVGTLLGNNHFDPFLVPFHTDFIFLPFSCSRPYLRSLFPVPDDTDMAVAFLRA